MIRKAQRAAVDQIRRRGLQVRRLPPSLALDRSLDITLELTIEHLVALHLVEPAPDFFFVQVGAFDGTTNDPIHGLVERYGWAGLLVEPQLAAFRRLKATYADHPKLDIRNAAVGESDGMRPFYTVSEAPEWVDQLASFDPKSILRYDRPGLNLREKITSTDVQVLTFDSLLSDVDHIDLLQIDTEGFDGRLISMFDFARWRPSIVQFEHRHLSLAEHERAVLRLARHGYRVGVSRFDTLSYRDCRVKPEPG